MPLINFLSFTWESRNDVDEDLDVDNMEAAAEVVERTYDEVDHHLRNRHHLRKRNVLKVLVSTRPKSSNQCN
jgi:hypothetical protein